MIIRKFNIDQDYEEYASWWNEKGWNPPPLSALPKTGLSVLINNKLVGCSFLALTDTDTCLFVYYFFDDNLKDKNKVFEMLVKHSQEITKVLKKQRLFCFSEKRSVINFLKSNGFRGSEDSDFHLIWEV